MKEVEEHAQQRNLDCAQCKTVGCLAPPEERRIPRYCPTRSYPEALAEVRRDYEENPVLHRMAVESARTEAAGYGRATRVEEIMDFARRMGWRHLGIAHCVGLREEAAIACEIFEVGGFEVSSVCCKCGSLDKQEIGLTEEEKVHPGRFEPLCSPVGQAALLAEAGTEFNVVIGLCVGHDSMFFKHSQAPVTVLVAKDRVLGHNPVAALYTARSYYQKLMQPRPEEPESPRALAPDGGRKPTAG